jgi:CRP-like cAMP-binding protein
MGRTDVELLRQVPLFAELDPAQLHVIAFAASRISLAADEVLYEAGNEVGAGYLMLEGSAEAIASEGVLAKHRATVEPGWFLAELAMIANVPVSTTVRANTPTRLLKIENELFLRVCLEFPDAGAKVLRALGRKLDVSLRELAHVKHQFDGARPSSLS